VGIDDRWRLAACVVSQPGQVHFLEEEGGILFHSVTKPTLSALSHSMCKIGLSLTLAFPFFAGRRSGGWGQEDWATGTGTGTGRQAGRQAGYGKMWIWQ
jgi:hypothetical protein